MFLPRWLLVGLLAPVLHAANLPGSDERSGPAVTLNTRRTFPGIPNAGAWRDRAEDLRHQTLASSGILPLPERNDLRPRVFGRIERDGYSVEKVLIQPRPGFYLGGNLYRPLGQGAGPFPAILNPHGHWDAGRLADTPTGSVVARCIQFARMGIVAFAYDMTGYVDTIQFGPKDADGAIRVANYHTLQQKLFRAETNQLWNFTLLGVQTWNSVRALDFVASLPDVDPKRIGCTGASGGGSQTFLLAAVDDRIAVSAPIVMVSCSMQGGCWCENAPALRVDHSNMEYAAAFAPKPQILVAASGDWTQETMTVEGPAIEGVYRLFGAKDRLRYTRFDFPHNYNRTTREAVYAFFAQHLLGKPAADRIPEIPYTAEKPEDLKAFPDGRMPADAISEAEFTSAWIAERRDVVEKRLRSKDASAESLRVWRHTLLIDPSEPVVGESAESSREDGIVRSEVAFGRPGKGDRVSGVLWIPAKAGDIRSVVVLVHPEGAQVAEKGGAERARMEALVARGHAVLAITPFQCGPGTDGSVVGRSPFQDFFAGYNRTVMQQRVRDVASAATFARLAKPDAPVVLLGAGRAALWAALAAPMADALVLAPSGLGRTDAEWIRPEDFVPGIHLLGDAEGALVAAGPKPVLREATASAEKLDRWVGSLPRR
jgi:hypothetical protein